MRAACWGACPWSTEGRLRLARGRSSAGAALRGRGCFPGEHHAASQDPARRHATAHHRHDEISGRKCGTSEGQTSIAAVRVSSNWTA